MKLEEDSYRTLFPGILHQIIQKFLYTGISGKVLLDILCRFLFADTQILAQPKGADAVHNPEIHRLGVAPLQIRDLLKGRVEYLGSSNPVNILIHTIGLYQLIVS